MFGLISKREALMYVAQIHDLKSEINRLHTEVERERNRADAAVNALLIKTNKVALTPKEPGLTLDQEDEMKERMLDLFGDNTPLTEEEALERIQS